MCITTYIGVCSNSKLDNGHTCLIVLVAPCVAAGRVLQRLSFFAVFIAFSLSVLVMSYTIFCVVAPGTQRCVLFRRLRSIFRVFARLKFAR